MLGKLLLAFVLVPLLDLFLLLKVAEWIGTIETVALVIVTGIVGGVLARTQGTQTMRRLQHRMSQGESPSSELADGVLILVGGAFLLTPGVVTDFVGFLLLLPFTRPYVRRALRSYFERKVETGDVKVEFSTEWD
ncbi:MAG: FxsA family protein [Halobacteria archaeon]|nr:FxsA family protein [Halobacteria archaeon]